MVRAGGVARAHRPRNICLLLIVLLVLGGGAGRPTLARSATASPATAAADTVDPSWLSRNLDRFFGDDNQQAQDLQGQARRVVDDYLPFQGRSIEVVIVHQVPSFAEGWNRDRPASQRLLTGLTGSFQSYTRDRIIRQYLLFRRGDRVDPYLLADSEALLRRLPYINDVRLVVVPLADQSGPVAIVVETTDKWPVGVDGKIIKADEFLADLYTVNLAGVGLGLSNRILHKGTAPDAWGYRGRLFKDNLAGQFLAAELVFEDSYRRHAQAVRLQRGLAHDGLRLLGGLALEHVDDYTKPLTAFKYDHQDLWLGGVARLADGRKADLPGRSLLVPALRYERWDHLARPSVGPLSNRQFHDRRAFLAGLTYQRLKNYKSSYLFGVGETEDLRLGLVAKLSGGYEIREFQERVVWLAELGLLAARPQGQFWLAGAELGGYHRRGHLEEGVLNLKVGTTSRLFSLGNHRLRFFGQARYTLGLNRYTDDRLFLEDRSGLRDLTDGQVAGNQRLILTGESRLFTDWDLYGFRFSFLLFADTGLIGGEDSSSLWQEKVYVSSGLGVRLRNPSLVLPTVQLQASVLSNVEDSGLALVFKVGNVGPRPLLLPGIVPRVPVYE